MKKFGGEGRLRQKCRLRQCLKLSKVEINSYLLQILVAWQSTVAYTEICPVSLSFNIFNFTVAVFIFYIPFFWISVDANTTFRLL